MIEPGQIYFFPKVRIGKAEYPRPGLVLQASQLNATVCYFSTKFDLMEIGAVIIEKIDIDFAASGLKDSSYLIDQAISDVPSQSFKGAKLLGHATGEFKKRIEEWYGMPLR